MVNTIPGGVSADEKIVREASGGKPSLLSWHSPIHMWFGSSNKSSSEVVGVGVAVILILAKALPLLVLQALPFMVENRECRVGQRWLHYGDSIDTNIWGTYVPLPCSCWTSFGYMKFNSVYTVGTCYIKGCVPLKLTTWFSTCPDIPSNFLVVTLLFF